MTAGDPYPEASPYAGSTQVSGSTQVGSQVGSTQLGAGSDSGFDPGSASVGQLVSQVTNDLSTLMRQEFALAKAELTEEAKKAGKGAGALGAAGYLGYLASIFASLTLMFVLDIFLPIWAAALIVTVLYGVIAYVLFSKGKKQMKTVDPTPRQTVETLKEDVQWAKDQTR